jgi:hypothetical protein
LFSLLDKKDSTYNNYDIAFFDQEQRYNNYNNYLSRPCDLYYSLNFIETLLYTYKVRNQIKKGKYQDTVEAIEKFESFFQIFMASIFTETTSLFSKTDAKQIEYHPILQNNSFYKTTKMWEKKAEYMGKLEILLLDEDLKKLQDQIQHIDFILDTIVTIVKTIHNQQGDFYFIYKETNKFTNRDEFTEIF